MPARHIVAIGGSDAGISAALRICELDPSTEVTVVVADAYPNFSICGIPYYVSGEVTHWTNLAHRTADDLAATGMRVLTDTRATRINVGEHTLDVLDPTGAPTELSYDALIVGTGAVSARPPITGLTGPDALGPKDGVHLLHSMGDTFAVMESLEQRQPATAVIIGAGYIGLEMAEGLTTRGIAVTQIEALPEVLPTVDPELGALVHDELERHGVQVLTHTTVSAVTRTANGALTVTAHRGGETLQQTVDFVLVVVGVKADVELAADAGAELGIKGAIAVDEAMRTTLSDVFAAGDCVHTHHRLLGVTGCRWAPLPTSRAASPGRTRSAGQLASPAASAPRWSRSSTWWPPAPACATMKCSPPTAGGHRSLVRPPRMTTRRTTRARPRFTFGSPATNTPADCWVPSSSDTAAPKSPNGSTPTPPHCFTR